MDFSNNRTGEKVISLRTVEVRVLSDVGGLVTFLRLLEPSFSVLSKATVSPRSPSLFYIPSHICLKSVLRTLWRSAQS